MDVRNEITATPEHFREADRTTEIFSHPQCGLSLADPHYETDFDGSAGRSLSDVDVGDCNDWDAGDNEAITEIVASVELNFDSRSECEPRSADETDHDEDIGPHKSCTRNWNSPPPLDSDNETISEADSIDGVSNDVGVADAMSDRSLSSSHIAFPSNIANDHGQLRLNRVNLELNAVVSAHDISETTRSGLAHLFSDDTWTVYSPSRTQRSANAIDQHGQLALDNLVSTWKDVKARSSNSNNESFALKMWLGKNDF